MDKITPCLWFDRNAEEAVAFYASVFKDTRTLAVSRYGKGGPGPEGSVMTISFEVRGQQLLALNGGPHFTFTPAISLIVACETQEEIDEFWEKLSAGGQKGRCGWLTDRFGLSWQIVPADLPRLAGGGDAAKSERMMQALLKMDKLDIKLLQDAYDRG